MRKVVKSAHTRPRLTVDISPALKRRIRIAAAARDMPVSAYVARVLEHTVNATESLAGAGAGAGDGLVTTEMLQEAETLRAEQRAPFPEDSADLVREAREQRYLQS
jgi:hypothetical protein